MITQWIRNVSGLCTKSSTTTGINSVLLWPVDGTFTPTQAAHNHVACIPAVVAGRSNPKTLRAAVVNGLSSPYCPVSHVPNFLAKLFQQQRLAYRKPTTPQAVCHWGHFLLYSALWKALSPRDPLRRTLCSTRPIKLVLSHIERQKPVALTSEAFHWPSHLQQQPWISSTGLALKYLVEKEDSWEF